MDTRFHADELLTAEHDPRISQNEQIRQILQTGVDIEQSVEAQYLRVGRSFTYGPIRRLFEEYAAEVRDHARILGRHLRDMKELQTKKSGRRLPGRNTGDTSVRSGRCVPPA